MDNDSGNDKGSIAIRKEPVQELREVIKSNEEHQKELAAIQHQQKFNEIMASSAHQIIKMDKMIHKLSMFIYLADHQSSTDSGTSWRERRLLERRFLDATREERRARRTLTSRLGQGIDCLIEEEREARKPVVSDEELIV